MSWTEKIVQVEALVGSRFIPFLLITFFFILSLLYIFRWQQKVWLINQIPGPKTKPFFGNALDINVEPAELFKILWHDFCKYGSSISRMWILNIPYIIIYKAKAAEVILSSEKYIEKSIDYNSFRPWIKTGLLTSTGKKWHSRRKMLTPAFHFRILEDFIDVFNTQGAKLVSILEKKADGEPFDVYHKFTLCTFDIILEAAMGSKINAQENEESDYVKAVYRMTEIMMLRFKKPWLRSDFIFNLTSVGREQTKSLKIIHKFSSETIQNRRIEYRKVKASMGKIIQQGKDEEEVLGKKKRLAFLDLLLEYAEGNGSNTVISNEDIQEEVDTFMFEGHDTTAAAFNWLIYLLGLHPEIQDKVFEELYSLFGDTDRTATSADLNEMKYLDLCIKEALRLFPSVPIFSRKLNQDVVIDGFKVPAGSMTFIMPYSLHRDPEQFPDPELFNPERFLSDNCTKRHPYAYIPFSAGPRNCIGQKFAMMEEKVVMSAVLRKFRVESVIKRENLKVIGDIILRPEGGNIIKLYPRK